MQAASNTAVPAASTPLFLSDVDAQVPFRSIEVPPSSLLLLLLPLDRNVRLFGHAYKATASSGRPAGPCVCMWVKDGGQRRVGTGDPLDNSITFPALGTEGKRLQEACIWGSQ